MVELKGSLDGIGLPSIVQLIGELHHTGTLNLTRESTRARGSMAFEDGRLVASECGHEHGLQAVAACALELGGADFAFVEGVPTVDRTLDLGPADLNKLLMRITSGDFAHTVNGDFNHNGEDHSETVCALLGFADDRGRHYSRPTALHRCFAGGVANLVNATDQRHLCLSGRYAVCPRFPDTDATLVEPPARLSPTTAVVDEGQPPVKDMPPGVAARLAAANQFHMAPAPSAEPVSGPVPPRRAPEPPPSVPEEDGRSRRAVLLIAGGALVGVALIALFLVFVLPMFVPSPPARQAATVNVVAQPVATPTTGLPVVAAVQATSPARPTSAAVPLAAASPTAPTRPATAVAAGPRPTLGAAGRTLLDLRLAAGPPDRWLNHAPYADWSDGAYRLDAHDATRFVAVGVPIDEVLGDVLVSATFRKTGGPPGGGYGLVVRDQGPEPRDGVSQDLTGYVFETGDLGEFGVWRRDSDHWVDLVPWTRSSTVRAGGSPNDLTVRAVGNAFTFTINGVDLVTLVDDTLASGGVGLFVGGDYNQVAVDRFTAQAVQ